MKPCVCISAVCDLQFYIEAAMITGHAPMDKVRSMSRMRIGLALLLVICACGNALAGPEDAQKAAAMLERVVVAVQQDQAAAIAKFTAGSDGFKDNDIYPFCFRVDDGIVITGQTAGRDIRTFGNPTTGQQLFEAAQKPDGVTTEVRYLARRPPPADNSPVPKVSLVRRIGQIGCGVGYYP